MREFKAGNKYDVGGTTFEIMKRTKKFVLYIEIQHAGKFNERKSEEKRTKIYNHKDCEYFYSHPYEVEA